MKEKLIVHVRKNDDGSWAAHQELSGHLENPARLAELHAAKFNSGKWGKAALLIHDACKGRIYSKTFLRYKLACCYLNWNRVLVNKNYILTY